MPLFRCQSSSAKWEKSCFYSVVFCVKIEKFVNKSIHSVTITVEIFHSGFIYSHFPQPFPQASHSGKSCRNPSNGGFPNFSAGVFIILCVFMQNGYTTYEYKIKMQEQHIRSCILS